MSKSLKDEEADNGLENCLLTNFNISTAFIEYSFLRPSVLLDG